MRKSYIDNIKWITVMIVVIYHVIFMYNGFVSFGVIGAFSDKVQYQDAFMYFVYPWFMLLLFTVSGMNTAFYLKNHTHKEFIKSRTRKLLVPSTIGLIIWCWATGYYNMKISGAFEQMSAVPKPILFLIMAVSGTGTLWYIQVLWLFSVFIVLFRKIEKNRLYNICEKINVPTLILFTAIIWASAQILNTPVIVVYRFGIYGAGFLIGYLVLSHDNVMDRLEKWWLPLSISAVICCVVFTVMYWGKNYADHEVLDTLMCNIYAWAGTLAVLAFMKKWGRFENSFSKLMIKKSWGIYIFHYLPLVATAYYLHTYAKNLPEILIYLLTGISALAVSILMNEIISRIPILKWCILGIGGKKKNVC